MDALLPVLLLSSLLQVAPHGVAKGAIPAGEEQESSVTSPDTRAEMWKEERLEKKKNLTPFKPSKFERRLVNFEKEGFGESLGVRFWDLYTDIGGITTGAGLAATVRYFRANLFESPLDVSVSAGYSKKGYEQYGFQFGNILRKSPELFLRYSGAGGLSQFEKTKETEGDFYYFGEVLYRYYPQEDFFGLGNDSREEDKTDFLLKGPSYDAVLGMRFGPSVGVFVKTGLLQPEVRNGSDDTTPSTQELFDDLTAPGLNEQPDFIRFASSFFVDYRDVFGNPTTGGLYSATYAQYFDRDNGDFDFRRLAFDVRQYFPLGSEQRILAARFYSSFDSEIGDSRVPFYLMQTLGGSDSIRGFSEFRFRDKNLFLLSTEYRWIPHPVWELVLFYDTGKVFPDLSDFDFTDLKRGYGVGMRLKSTDDVVMRFDLGKSKEGFHFYFKFNASF
jgi:outer membrane protein assembly factor BamA